MKWKLKINIFNKCITNPLFVMNIIWFLYNVCYICQWGGFHKRKYYLCASIVLFIILFLLYILLYIVLNKKSEKQYYIVENINNKEIILKCNEKEISVDTQSVIQFWNDKINLFLILKGFQYLQCDISLLSNEKKNFLLIKLSTLPMLKRYFWKKKSCFIIVLSIIFSSLSIIYSSIPYNGYLSWKLKNYYESTKLDISNGNIYDSGGGFFDVMLKQLGITGKVSISGDFILSFNRSGKILSFEMVIHSFDDNEELQEHYLISYNIEESDKVMVRLIESDVTTYDVEKDFRILVNFLNVVDFKDGVKYWNEEEYGILYRGVRNWRYDLEQIRMIDDDGNVTIPDMMYEVEGYCISLYCPNRSDIAPIRYIYHAEDFISR